MPGISEFVKSVQNREAVADIQSQSYYIQLLSSVQTLSYFTGCHFAVTQCLHTQNMDSVGVALNRYFLRGTNVCLNHVESTAGQYYVIL
jgi:hypothetical protein